MSRFPSARLTVEIKFNGDINPFRDGNISIFGWVKCPAFDGVLCGLIQRGMSAAFVNFHLAGETVRVDECSYDDGPFPSGFSRHAWVGWP